MGSGIGSTDHNEGLKNFSIFFGFVLGTRRNQQEEGHQKTKDITILTEQNNIKLIQLDKSYIYFLNMNRQFKQYIEESKI